MPGMHPSDIELLELVEGDLDDASAAAVTAHVEGCEGCREELRLLETGRSALRASPLVELPADRLEAMLSALPAQERERGRLASLLHSPRRLAVALVPVAAVVAAVVGITIATGNGNGERSAGADAAATAGTIAMEAQAEEAPATAAEAAPGGEADEAPALESATPDGKATGTGPFLVAGPVDEVARLLEDAGFQVAVSGQTVTVTGADPEAVSGVLGGRTAGDVEVVVRPG